MCEYKWLGRPNSKKTKQKDNFFSHYCIFFVKLLKHRQYILEHGAVCCCCRPVGFPVNQTCALLWGKVWMWLVRHCQHRLQQWLTVSDGIKHSWKVRLLSSKIIIRSTIKHFSNHWYWCFVFFFGQLAVSKCATLVSMQHPLSTCTTQWSHSISRPQHSLICYLLHVYIICYTYIY